MSVTPEEVRMTPEQELDLLRTMRDTMPEWMTDYAWKRLFALEWDALNTKETE